MNVKGTGFVRQVLQKPFQTVTLELKTGKYNMSASINWIFIQSEPKVK
jgi:hypothetical protein